MTQGITFQPTAEQRSQVEVLAGFGLPQAQIAVLLGCDPKTLRKHFERELEVGDAKATAKIAQTLFNKAVSGDTASLIFWMKVRAGWRETARVELSGPDGGALQIAAETARERIMAKLANAAAGQAEQGELADTPLLHLPAKDLAS